MSSNTIQASQEELSFSEPSRGQGLSPPQSSHIFLQFCPRLDKQYRPYSKLQLAALPFFLARQHPKEKRKICELKQKSFLCDQCWTKKVLWSCTKWGGERALATTNYVFVLPSPYVVVMSQDHTWNARVLVRQFKQDQRSCAKWGWHLNLPLKSTDTTQ